MTEAMRVSVPARPNDRFPGSLQRFCLSCNGARYLAIVLDAFSRRIVGWSMAFSLRTDVVLGTLETALSQRRPRSVVDHSGRGSQCTSLAFSRRCRQAGVLPSMGKAGDCFDNAMAESFFASLECELIDRKPFRDRGHARRELFSYIEGWYNAHRRHSGIGHRSPVNFEKSYR